MSRFNGDKARFNRERKQNIQRRKRTRALFQAAAASASHPDARQETAGVSDAGKDRA